MLPVNVLLVKVSVVALPTKVSVVSGRVSVRSLVCDDRTVIVLAVVAPPRLNFNALVRSDTLPTVVVESLSFLLVRVSTPAKVASVPVVGRVTPVAPVTVNVVA